MGRGPRYAWTKTCSSLSPQITETRRSYMDIKPRHDYLVDTTLLVLTEPWKLVRIASTKRPSSIGQLGSGLVNKFPGPEIIERSIQTTDPSIFLIARMSLHHKRHKTRFASAQVLESSTLLASTPLVWTV